MNHLFSRIFICLTALTGSLTFSVAQETYPSNGPRDASHNHYVFTNANVVTSPGQELRNVTLIIRDEKIVAVGSGLEIPKNSVISDLKGKWIYPGFIELNSDYGMPKTKEAKRNWLSKPQMDSKKKGAYAWNEAIKPEVNAAEMFKYEKKSAEALRRKGYTTVLSHSRDGIVRGTSVLVHTGTENENLSVIKAKSGLHFSFKKGSSQQVYPSSLMGSISLLRQTFYDAEWYAASEEKREENISLEALNASMELPLFFEVSDHLTALRADKVSDEFEYKFNIIGSGDEYRRIDQIKETGSRFVIPLKLPAAFDIRNSYDALDLNLTQLKHWEMAPYNARILNENEVEFSFSSEGLNHKDHWSSLKKIEKSGLEEDVILEALTTKPAEMLGMENEIGQIKTGYYANLLIFSDPWLEKGSVLMETWVNGQRYVLSDPVADIRGKYNLNVNKNGGLTLVVSGTLTAPKAKFDGKNKSKVDLTLNGRQISLRYNKGTKDNPQYVLLSGTVNDEESRIWVGKGQLPSGKWVDWAAIKQSDFEPELDTTEIENDSVAVPGYTYPMTAYGFDEIPDAKAYLFKHATIWTNEDTGVVENYDICISEGKILAVGKSLSRVGLFGAAEVDLEIIDATDKHITSGVIDEHSHIAISRGVNERAQSSSAEVRIGDVINSDDVNIYRQLSGGVVAAQLLHGSANPIGGQSGLIKFRWGLSPEQMKIEGADGFIKFALGENVKQSNWGRQHNIRYPQTRMGVEQVYYDAFYRAQEYADIHKIYESGLKSRRNKKNPPVQPRVDLDLQALAEILDSTRFITCHSYVQSEINMLMHVGDSMGFRVNTFTHILEGYKVADKMKEHGVGGSTFSDWWAYKYEVNDAIPYNASLMAEQGITTAINSDDAEMGRRLNQEAAKVVKYGGTSEEEAWKTVTLNPAKLLHLDDHMGSLKEGKDADVVIWSDHPMSVNAKAEMTFVDGVLLYEMNRDKELRKALETERARLIQLMIDEKKRGGKTRPVEKKKMKLYECDTFEDEGGYDF